MKDQTPRGGRIINNGSISAHTPRPHHRRLHRDQACRHRASPNRPRSTAAPTTSPAARSISAMPHALTERMVHKAKACCRPTAACGRAAMDVEDVGDAVLYMASLPLDANVLFMTVMATKMPYRRARLMHVESATLALEGWHDFYLLLGTAAAALVASTR